MDGVGKAQRLADKLQQAFELNGVRHAIDGLVELCGDPLKVEVLLDGLCEREYLGVVQWYAFTADLCVAHSMMEDPGEKLTRMLYGVGLDGAARTLDDLEHKYF